MIDKIPIYEWQTQSDGKTRERRRSHDWLPPRIVKKLVCIEYYCLSLVQCNILRDSKFFRSVSSKHGRTDQTFFVLNISIQVSHTGLLYFWDICKTLVKKNYIIYLDWQQFHKIVFIFCFLLLLNRWTKFLKNIHGYFLWVNNWKPKKKFFF